MSIFDNLPINKPKFYTIFNSKTGRDWQAVPEGWNWEAAILPPLWLGKRKYWGLLVFYALIAFASLYYLPDFLIKLTAEQISNLANIADSGVSNRSTLYDKADLYFRLAVLSRLLFIMGGFFLFGLYANGLHRQEYNRKNYSRIGDIFKADTPKQAIIRAKRLSERRKKGKTPDSNKIKAPPKPEIDIEKLRKMSRK